jgi:hypothetical protein
MQFILDEGPAAENSGLSQRPVSPRNLDDKKAYTSSNSGAGEGGALRPRTPLTSTTDGSSGVKLTSAEVSLRVMSSSQEHATSRAAADSPKDEDSFQIHRQGVNDSLSLSRIEYSVESFRDDSREGEGLAPSEDDDTETESVEARSDTFDNSVRDEDHNADTTDVDTPQEESEDARIARELAESEALAWQMMQQEADNAYHLQMEYMRNNRDQMSQEDYEALNQIVTESALPAAAAPPTPSPEPDEREGAEREEGDSSDSSAAWEDPNNYDRLLALGNHIGDVKTERWRQRSQAIIESLPLVSYSDVLSLLRHKEVHATKSAATTVTTTSSQSDSARTTQEDSCSRDSTAGSPSVFSCASHAAGGARSGCGDCKKQSTPENKLVRTLCCDDSETSPKKRLRSFCDRVLDTRCAVCMEAFEEKSVEELMLMPCNHYFHQDCAAGWLTDNNSCPICKLQVSE